MIRLLIFLISVWLLTTEVSMALELKSNDFEHKGWIEELFTCDGDDISPQLHWSGVPKGTKTFALLMYDPDAPMGTWDHWVVFNIPANITSFERGERNFPTEVTFGANSWERNDYGGPCPPDREHRYFFKLLALDNTLQLPAGASRNEVENAAAGHILAETELMGRYNRPQNR